MRRSAPPYDPFMPDQASTVPARQPQRQPAPARTEPAPALRDDPRGLLGLQRAAGNRAVASAVQRVDVKTGSMSETLYNQSGAGGKAAAKKYSLNPAYVLTRNGDAGLTVKVRVKFLHQVRNATGALVGTPTEIPATDPDDRRGWASKLVQEQVKPWNGHLTLVGEEVNVFSANTKKRIPVTFVSEAVFGLNDPFDNIVIIHPSAVVAGSPGQPIDAGNYYLNKGNYSADEKIIAAHEYGHLIGIPDEYSQSNEQMNALLHNAAPKGAPSARAALDKATVEKMVLSSMKQPLYDALSGAMPAVTDALRAKRAAVKKQLAAAAKAGVQDAAVRAELTNQLTTAADPKLAPAVPGTVAFQTTTNFSNRDLASTTVEAGFSAAALRTLIQDRYWQALVGAENANVAIKDFGDVRVNVAQSVRNTTMAGGAQAGDAANAAAGSVGNAGGPSTFLGLPVILPPSGLTGQLMGIPAQWGAAGSTLEAGITPAAFAAKMAAVLKASGAAAAIAALIPGLAPAKIGKAGRLYSRAHAMVGNAAAEAARQLSADLLNTVIPPVLTAGVTSLQASVAAEVAKVMGTPPAGVAALGPNPAMANLATAMKAKLDADKAAAAGGGQDPLGSGKAAPDQNVTYSYQGLMGSNATTAVRQDQFQPIVKQFNDKLTNRWEKDFKAEVK
jgi:hypothetical protein